MAHTTFNCDPQSRSFTQALGAFFASIGRGLVAMGANSGRYRRLQALSAMSDAELAARGLKREDIVRHVFADVYYA